MSDRWSCIVCEEPETVRTDMIPTDAGPIHRGVCHQRHSLHLEDVDMTVRLWAALSLWDYRQQVLVRVTLPPAPGNRMKRQVTGVIFDHRTEGDIWLLEDEKGKVYEFSTPEKMEVVEDEAVAA